MMAVWTTKTNKQAQGKCGRTVWWGRWLPIARGHCRARKHYGAVAVLILNKPLISRPQICQSCLWESQKTWKVGSFITMKLLLPWWSGSLILVFAWIYRWSSLSVAKSACFSQVPPRGLLPYMAFNGMCLWRVYGFCPLHPEQGIQYHPSLS